MKKTIGIVIVNYRTYEKLERAIESLHASLLAKNTSIFLAVVDSESNQSKLKKIKHRYPNLDYLVFPENIGCGKAYNSGVLHLNAKCSPKYLLLMNADAWIEKETLMKLIKRMDDDENLAAVSPKILLPTRPAKIYFAGGKIDPLRMSGGHLNYREIDSGKYASHGETDFINMAVALLRTRPVLKVGLFDPDYFLYYEDTDLSWRLVKSGYRIAVELKAVAWHDTSEESNSARSHYYLARNLLRFIRKHASVYAQLRAYLATVKEIIKKTIELLVHPKKRITNYYTILGIVDGFLNVSGQKDF
ncbi:glycosyltransferase family 2 protein [Candidatus Woesebacteria bacterium]|nr:glycosyltransferase family 2 protein [Candidatus Woesebacteria bacterium]